MPKLTPQQRERNESMHNWLDQYMVKHPPPYTKHEKMLIRDVLMAKFGGGRKQTLSLLSRKIDRFGKSRKARTPTVLTAQNLEIAVRFMSKKNMNSAELLRAMWRDNRNLKMSDTSARSLHKLALPLATQRRHEISLRRAATRQKFELLLRRVIRFNRKICLFTEHSKFLIEKRRLLVISRRREKTLWICERMIARVMVCFGTVTWYKTKREIYGYGTRAMMLFYPVAGDLYRFWLWRSYVALSERRAVESQERLDYLNRRAHRQSVWNRVWRDMAVNALPAAATPTKSRRRRRAKSGNSSLKIAANDIKLLKNLNRMTRPEVTPKQWQKMSSKLAASSTPKRRRSTRKTILRKGQFKGQTK